jgi:hypothetical protein
MFKMFGILYTTMFLIYYGNMWKFWNESSECKIPKIIPKHYNQWFSLLKWLFKIFKIFLNDMFWEFFNITFK